MILSSADILRILSGDAIVREEAELKIVEGRPGIGVGDKVYIYIDKYPTIDEFEATWNIWVQDNSGMGSYVLNAMTVLLPNFDFNGKHHTTTDFASDRTVVKTQEEIDREEFKAERVEFENRFSGIQKGVEERLSAVRDGVDGRDGLDGKDGLPGRDGRDGRDGKDLDATEVDLFDLADVERGIPLHRGQVLTWNGQEWTNLFVPQVWSVSGGGGSGSGDGEGVIISDTAPETRDDGSALQEGDQWWDSSTGVMYVWYVDADSGQWVQSSGGDGGGSTTLAGLLDTDTTGVQDGEILVYRSATGDWTAEPAPATGLQSGDNVSELVNDAGYITLADVPDDAPVDSVNGQTGVVVLDADDIDDTSTTHKFATTAQLGLADTSIQPGDNISDLNNDAGYITLAEVPASGIPEAPQDGNYYVRQNDAWVNLVTALSALEDRIVGGGNFTTGVSDDDTSDTVDGGVFT